MASRLLFLSPEPATDALMQALAAEGHCVFGLRRPKATLPATRLFHPEAIVLDFSADAAPDLGVCQRLRTLSEAPIVLILPGDDRRLCVEALDAGASDCLLSPAEPGEVLARLRAQLRLRQRLARAQA